jgi:hypothetical protein
MRWGTLLSLGLLLCLSLPAMAQQKGKTLTNEDFPSGRQVNNETTVEKEKAADEKGDKADKDDKGEKGDKADKEGKTSEKDKAKADQEKEWQKKYTQVEQKVSALDKEKTQTELAAQQLRNQLRQGGADPSQFEAIKSQLTAAEQKLKELNSQYDEAKKTIESAKKEGSDKGYKEKKEEISKTTKDGRPNSQYYNKQFESLNERQRLASEKVQLYQARINEARQRAYQSRPSDPNRVGNAYYTDPEAKKGAEEAQTELQKAQEELEKVSQELEKLQRDAKSSGVSIK